MPMPARILIVDDEVPVAESTRDVLGQLGYMTAGLANSIEAALAAIERERPDLVLLDINLHQNQDGIAAAETIRTRHGLPVVCVVARAEEAMLAGVRIAHPFGYITKPYATHNLRIAIEAALHHQALEQRLRRSELTLRERERRQRAILDNIVDPAWLMDREGRFLAVNRAWCETFGMQEHQAVGKPPTRVLPPVVARGFHANDAAIIATGKPVQFEQQMTDRHGDTRWFDTSKAPLRNEREEIVGTIGIAREITRRKQAESALAEQTETYRALLCATLDGVLETDEDDRIIDANQAYCRLLGYTRMELTALRISDVEAVETAPEVLQHTRQLKREGGGRFETRHRAKDGRPIDLELSVTYIPSRHRFVAFCRDITKRKQAEAVLRKSETALNAAQRVAHVGSWSWHIPSNRVEWSEEMFRIFGLEPAGFSGDFTEVIANRIHPDDRAAVERSNRSVIDEGKPLALEYRVVRPDGTICVVWAESGELVLDEHGHPAVLTGVTHDITERKHAEEALRREQALFKDLISTIPDNIYFKDRKSRFVCINDAMARWFGMRSADDAAGKTDFDIFSEEHARQAYEDEQRIMSTGQPLIGLVEKETWPDGHVTWMSTTKVPLRDPSGAITGLVGISRDVTASKQDEERIRQQASLLDNANDAIYVRTLDHTITYWNRGAEQLYGWSAAEAVGRKETDLFLPITGGLAEADAALLAQSSWAGERQHSVKQGGNVTVFCRWSLVRDDAGMPQLVFAIHTDVTEKKRLEAQFLRAQKLENLGVLAHDFNNLLTGILGHTNLALMDLPPDTPVRESLRQIEKAATRATELCRQVLAQAPPSGAPPMNGTNSPL